MVHSSANRTWFTRSEDRTWNARVRIRALEVRIAHGTLECGSHVLRFE